MSSTDAPAPRGGIRRGKELLRGMSMLDALDGHPLAEAARGVIREQAEAMGTRIVSMTILDEPMPDPAIARLPRAKQLRIVEITRGMFTDPAKHLEELRVLVSEHPEIPMLHNHLIVALEASGEREEAGRMIEATAERFPEYVFALCSNILRLVRLGEIDKARGIVEEGPRGPLFVLTAVDPSRDTFHITEAVAHAQAMGHYLLATDREEAARVQLGVLRQLAPKSPQAKGLAAAIERKTEFHALSALLLKMKASLELGQKRAAARAVKKAQAGIAGGAGEKTKSSKRRAKIGQGGA